MQRYTIEDGDGDDVYAYQVHDTTGDTAEKGMIGPNFSEAEAGIIAFALNAVADGLSLQAGSLWMDVPDASQAETREYDGPTKGVRAR